jgi:hypothetical protein
MSEFLGKLKSWLMRSELWAIVLGVIVLIQEQNIFPEGSAGNKVLGLIALLLGYVLSRSGVKMARAYLEAKKLPPA